MSSLLTALSATCRVRDAALMRRYAVLILAECAKHHPSVVLHAKIRATRVLLVVGRWNENRAAA